jgi:hypothetical protein
MEKIYILQKDLLHLKAGQELIMKHGLWQTGLGETLSSISFSHKCCENNPEWFKMKEEPKEEKKELIDKFLAVVDEYFENKSVGITQPELDKVESVLQENKRLQSELNQAKERVRDLVRDNDVLNKFLSLISKENAIELAQLFLSNKDTLSVYEFILIQQLLKNK